MRALAIAAVLAIPSMATADRDPCERFSSVRGWDDVISFATCIQAPQVARIESAADAQSTVERLAGDLSPSMLLYAIALEHGPTEVKVRAAYHIGLTSVALVTRARSAIPAADLRSPTAVKTCRIVQARVERALQPAFDTARVSLELVVQLGEADSALARDPVLANMIRSAAAILALLQQDEPRTHLVHGAGDPSQPLRTPRRNPALCDGT